MEALYELVDDVFRSSPLVAGFAPLGSLMHCLRPDLRLPVYLELMEHPPVHILLHHISNITLVYSPPKVGSTTVAETLRRLPEVFRSSKVRHLHYLNSGGIRLLEDAVARFPDRPEVQLVIQALMHGHWARVMLAANRAVRSGGADPKVVKKPNVVTGVREPVAQYISSIFETRWMYAAATERITANRIRGWMSDDPWYRLYANWFADELGSQFGLDVLKTPFPTRRGWDVYETEAAHVLLVRQENLDALALAIGTFYGIDAGTVDVTRANEGGNKAYAAEYAELKQTVRLSADELDKIYSAPHVRHFYTAVEIDAFKTYWASSPEDRRALDAVRSKQLRSAPAVKPASLRTRVFGLSTLGSGLLRAKSIVRRLFK